MAVQRRRPGIEVTGAASPCLQAGRGLQGRPGATGAGALRGRRERPRRSWSPGAALVAVRAAERLTVPSLRDLRAMGWQNVITHLGYACELAGLAIAAFGMWRSWKVNAYGVPFWPPRIRSAYFRMARLWGQKPRPVYAHAEAAVVTVSGASGFVTVGRMAGATVDERLDALETDVDELKTSTQKLANEQEAQKKALGAAVAKLRREIADAQQTTERRLSAQTVTDLRPAAGGVALAAFGLLLQWLGTW
jgi:hypothetical protein